MKTYLVGGAVRDELLGRPVKDRDFVVVGATAKEMVDLGYTQVGADFPVFLHPQTKEEYALARQERKVAPGYRGFRTRFDPQVTLEDDLVRRDLTINAMARDENGKLIDLYGGQNDLACRVLRHVSPAFAEDPLRVLRVGRFAARYGFTIAPETLELMRSLVASGELLHLTPERVWSELSRAMNESDPMQFFHAMQACGANEVLFPELGRTFYHTGGAVSTLALLEAPEAHRFMVLLSEATETGKMLERLKAPTLHQKLVAKFQTVYTAVRRREWLTPEETFALLEKVDAFRQPEDLLEVGRAMMTLEHTKKMSMVLAAHKRAMSVNFTTVFPTGTNLKGAAVGEAIREYRLAAVRG
jgi:tRNA nucleotidyltransferase (CCA-adding enzyme)